MAGGKFISHRAEVTIEKDKAIEQALTAIGIQCRNYAARQAPVDTGNLRNSITFQVDSPTDSVVIGTNVEYGKYQEFGTSRMKAQPYLRPAVEEHLDEYKRIAESFLKGIK